MSREPGTGSREPADLMPQVYDELRRLAANYIRNERPGQTLQATALVHEAFQQAKIVELRYFGGLTVEEAAEALDISPATVKRHWTLARAFLKKELQPE
ncbi:MAG: hypothetical protein K2Y23_16415 [Cyanobacteria bacterium]|nr:hypothetical protein [Cyanobacteriota bacterium]